jgi:hypothetical protein
VTLGGGGAAAAAMFEEVSVVAPALAADEPVVATCTRSGLRCMVFSSSPSRCLLPMCCRIVCDVLLSCLRCVAGGEGGLFGGDDIADVAALLQAKATVAVPTRYARTLQFA